MPQHIDDVLSKIKRMRDVTKVTVDINVDINEEDDVTHDPHASPWERAKANADRDRRTLAEIEATIYRIIYAAAIPLSNKTALQRILSHGGKEAYDLQSLVACRAFCKLSKQGQAKALRLFLGNDRHLFVVMMVHSLSYQAVSGSVLEDVCDYFSGKSTARRKQLASLVETHILARHPFLIYKSISATEYDKKAKKILEIFDALSTPHGRSCFIDLCKYWYVAFSQTSSNDFLIDQLHSMVINGIDPIFARHGVSLQDILTAIMIECSNPGQVDQSVRKTCTATSMQYVLCGQYPGEYVRIMNGLCSQQGSVSLWNRDKLVRVNDSVPPDTSTRSPSERVFQSSLMSYALGRYSNLDPKNPGMHRDEEEKALEALFGADFEVVSGDGAFWGDQGAKILKELHKRKNLDKTFASLRWGNNDGHFVFIYGLNRRRVYFRNPWGAKTDPVGTMYYRPTRRMEDPELGLESMTYSVFKGCVRSIIWPKI